MKHLILVFGLLILSIVSYAQGKVLVDMHAATDYILTPEAPRYNYYGYDNQLGLRYGAGISIEVFDRWRLEIGADRYTRKEDFDCVHFPDPENLPQVNWQPLINNPDFSCDFKTTSRISFVEIPISVSYDFIKLEKLNGFFKVGYGYQFITGRKTTLLDLQNDVESTEENKSFATRSNSAFRVSTGLSRALSERLMLGLSIMYRSDSFQLEYQSIGVQLGMSYIFGGE